MKKITLVLGILFLLSNSVWSQSSLFNALRIAITEQQPQLDLNEKLIAYNFWEINDNSSREQNKEFEKAASVYRNAKLKGAASGIVVVLINVSDQASQAQITIRKDDIVFCCTIDKENVDVKAELSSSNGIFDPSGRVVAKNIPAERIYATVQSFITR